jgi:hypothetical protein
VWHKIIDRTNTATIELPNATSLANLKDIIDVPRKHSGRTGELAQALLHNDYWSRCLMLSKSKSSKQSPEEMRQLAEFVRLVLSLNSHDILSALINSAEKLSAALTVLESDALVLGQSRVDFNEVLLVHQGSFTNPFQLTDEVVNPVLSVNRLLYVKECALPQVLEDPEATAVQSLVESSLTQLLTALMEDPQFAQGVRGLHFGGVF